MMINLFQSVWWVLWLILFAGLMAIIIFAERAFHVHRARIKSDDFLKGVCNILRRGNAEEALGICEETPGPVAFMLRAAISHRDGGIEEIERAMNDAALSELARIEQSFSILATIAQTAPILGLFGTVWGMIRAFNQIQQNAPLVHVGDLSEGIWMALVTTAAGLIVAIVSYVGYNLLVSRVNGIALDMERSFLEMTAFFRRANNDQDKAL